MSKQKKKLSEFPDPDAFVKAGRKADQANHAQEIEESEEPAETSNVVSLKKRGRKRQLPDEPMHRFTIDLPESLHYKFKVIVTMKNESMADLIRKWVEGYVKRTGKDQWFE